MLRKLSTIVSILFIWLAPAWAGDRVEPPPVTATAGREELEMIAMMEILQAMDLVEEMDLLQDLDILTKEEPDDPKD